MRRGLVAAETDKGQDKASGLHSEWLTTRWLEQELQQAKAKAHRGSGPSLTQFLPGGDCESPEVRLGVDLPPSFLHLLGRRKRFCALADQQTQGQQPMYSLSLVRQKADRKPRRLMRQ